MLEIELRLFTRIALLLTAFQVRIVVILEATVNQLLIAFSCMTPYTGHKWFGNGEYGYHGVFLSMEPIIASSLFENCLGPQAAACSRPLSASKQQSASSVQRQ